MSTDNHLIYHVAYRVGMAVEAGKTSTTVLVPKGEAYALADAIRQDYRLVGTISDNRVYISWGSE